MKSIEAVHLRPYSRTTREEALEAFRQLAWSKQENGLEDIVILANTSVSGDLCISIHWHREIPLKDKSPLGLQLASAFSEFGQIEHSVWIDERKIHRKNTWKHR